MGGVNNGMGGVNNSIGEVNGKLYRQITYRHLFKTSKLESRNARKNNQCMNVDWPKYTETKEESCLPVDGRADVLTRGVILDSLQLSHARDVCETRLDFGDGGNLVEAK